MDISTLSPLNSPRVISKPKMVTTQKLHFTSRRHTNPHPSIKLDKLLANDYKWQTTRGNSFANYYQTEPQSHKSTHQNTNIRLQHETYDAGTLNICTPNQQ
jgi:hypothetical protein